MSDSDQVTPGFTLSRLVLRGADVADATLEFTMGLNVISGPSNTGKSFAFWCIDYLLGAKTIKKSVAEAAPYHEGLLEIRATDGNFFTVRRDLNGATKLRWYSGRIQAVLAGDLESTELSARHSKSSDQNLSSQLLTLAGFETREVRKNARGDTRSLSFRDLVHLALMGEEKIISVDSPLLTGNPTSATGEKSVFQLLLSGKGADSVEPAPTSEPRAVLEAKAAVLDELIEASRDPGQEDLAALRDRLAKIKNALYGLEERATTSAEAVDVMRQRVDELRFEFGRNQSRLIVVRELLTRFDLLSRSYSSDLDRLQLVADGADLLSQLPLVTCPVCGSPLGQEEERHGHTTPDLDREAVLVAAEREATKIRALQHDLSSAYGDLEEERVRREAQGAEIRQRMEDEEADLATRLEPGMTRLSSELLRNRSEEQEIRIRIAEAERRSDLISRRHALTLILDRKRQTAVAAIDDDRPSTAQVTSSIRQMLSAWGVVDATDVRFDWDTFDLVVDGRPRGDQGKGVRALWCAALILSVMDAVSGPHPGYVVLDSPLTTFRGPDQANSDGVSSAVERAFFRDLADRFQTRGSNKQVIVFENKEPPASLEPSLNYVRFTKIVGSGREGFIPNPS